jgi:hypothetical protein
MPRQQLRLAPLRLPQLAVPRRQGGELALHAHEFRPIRIAVVLQPVGEDQPAAVVLGVLLDVFQQRPEHGGRVLGGW